VRIIAATNKDLPTLIAEKKFREDLYYRLNVFTLNLPPLRERKETIPNLIKLFVHKNNEKMDKHISAISPGAEALLAGYDYPGNVRELENILEHAMVLADTNEITEKDLPEFMTPMRLLLTAPQTQALCAPQSVNDIVTLAEYEKQYIKKALVVCKNNYSEAAKKLGVSRSTLWRKIKEYSLASNNTIEN
jgi:two-component system nitrogen regulation response regulator GlnG/two-component system response regulator HydG